MGMLGAAFLQGAGQGMNTLAAGMMRGVERDEEQTIWEKRAAMLEQLRRESAKTLRKDEFDFRNDPANVAAEVGTATTKAEAAGKVGRQQALLTATDPDLRAAKKTNEDEDAAAARERKLQDMEALANDPRATAAVRKEASLKAEALREEVRIRSDGAIRVARATDRAAPQTMAQKVAEIEGVIGRPLSQQEREGLAGLGKKDDGMAKWMRGLVDEDIKAGNITADKAPERLQQIENGFRMLDQDSAIGSAVQQARQDGKAVEAAEELRSKGFSDEQLAKWFTPAELKKAEATKGVAARLQRGATPLGTMFDATASKIATDNYISRTQPGR